MNKKSKSLLLQILTGFAAALLETFTMQLLNGKQPLYMDCIWTVASSFFSITSGMICAIFFHVFATAFGFVSVTSLVFIICSISIVITVRLYVRIEKKYLFGAMKFAGLGMLVIAETLLISIEGGLLYILIFDVTRYGELSSTNSFVFGLFMQDVPYAVAAILGRIPVNLADKAIAIFAGYGIWMGTKRFLIKGTSESSSKITSESEQDSNH